MEPPSTSKEILVDDGEISEDELVTPSNESRNMNSSEPKNKKQKITTFQQNLLDLMKHPPILTRSDDIDPDKAFLLSFLPDFKKMDDNQKLDFKISFMQTVKKILNPPKNNSQAFNSNIQQFDYPNYIGQQGSLTHTSSYPSYTQPYYQHVRPSSSYSLPGPSYSSPTSPDCDKDNIDIEMHHSV